MNEVIVVAGIGTEVGKTVAAAILTEMLLADYWKPISCAPSDSSDSLFVARLLDNGFKRCHREAYSFTCEVAPQRAAKLQGVTIEAEKISLPKAKTLVVEMAGGVAVPLNDSLLAIDHFASWQARWVVVSHHYLGSINHTLLTVESLRRRSVEMLGLIYNGGADPMTEQAIECHTGLPCVGRLEVEKVLNRNVIRRYAEEWSRLEPWNTQLRCSAAT